MAFSPGWTHWACDTSPFPSAPSRHCRGRSLGGHRKWPGCKCAGQTCSPPLKRACPSTPARWSGLAPGVSHNSESKRYCKRKKNPIGIFFFFFYREHSWNVLHAYLRNSFVHWYWIWISVVEQKGWALLSWLPLLLVSRPWLGAG